MKEGFQRPNIWSNIDLLKVKQRIERITAQIERVRQQFDPQVEADNSSSSLKEKT
jgi:hypothetical protein